MSRSMLDFLTDHVEEEKRFTARTTAAIVRMAKAGRAPSFASFTRRGFGNGMSGCAKLYAQRYTHIASGGFALLSAEVLACLRRLGPIVEIGAGNGLWSCALKAAGHDVIATDPVCDGFKKLLKHGYYCAIENFSGDDAVLAYPDRDVLCVWPSYDEPWAAFAVASLGPGRMLALVGEGQGGCTGDDHLFEILERDFDQIACNALMPQWPGLHDELTLWRRRP